MPITKDVCLVKRVLNFLTFTAVKYFVGKNYGGLIFHQHFRLQTRLKKTLLEY